MSNRTALAGLKIVVTRPHEQADHLVRLISQAGGTAIRFPLLTIHPSADLTTLKQQVANIYSYNLAVFISPNAVRYGMEAVLAAGGLPPHIKIAAMGPGSVQALREYGVQEIIAPPAISGQGKFDSETLLVLPELQNVAGWNVLIFRGDGGRELLGDTLKLRGAQVEYVSCYQRRKPPLNLGELLAVRPDALTVTSSEALVYLHEMLDQQTHAIILRIPLFVPHARIAEAAHKLGWQTITKTAGGDEGLLQGLMAWAENTAGER